MNFYVDEVGQFIANNTQRMLNLQTVVETLNTVCGGQAWIFVTSQASLEAVVGRDPGQDFSRIQDRFRVKVNLDGKDVSEVIQLRLLKKKREYISDLNQTYEREKENIRTLFTFGDGTQTYQTINSADEFVKTYPVIPYQYDLFQRVMIGLSSHSAFTGQQTSVGERSMLGVFQDVLKEMADLDETNLASFDKMFQGIRQALRPNYLNLINLAENNLSHQPLALKLLRALALVKYVDSFKATIQNLSILLIDEFQVPIGEFQKQVAESLQLLEQQTYIQRNGDLYSYLTNIEKDVENEIKTTSISDSDQIKLLSDLIFNEVIQTKQYRFDDNRQNYIFARKMDGTIALGQDAELAINVVGPFHENSGNESIIRNQSMGKAEMLVLLSEDRDLLEDLTMFLKTERYLKTSGMGQVDDSVRSIHREKGDINQNRRRQLRARVENLLKESKIIVSNRELDLSGDGTTKLERGFKN